MAINYRQNYRGGSGAIYMLGVRKYISKPLVNYISVLAALIPKIVQPDCKSRKQTSPQ